MHSRLAIPTAAVLALMSLAPPMRASAQCVPTITCPSTPGFPGVLHQCTDPGLCGAVVHYTPTTTDSCGQTVTVNCTVPSGSTFPFGQTSVTCTATNQSGNTAMCTFTVDISDCEPPQFNCPSPITQCAATGQCSATVTYQTPTAHDNCNPHVVVNCLPASGSTFPLGTTTVRCDACDGNDQCNHCTFTITVNDCDAPSITCPADISVCATQKCGATVTYQTPTAHDACSGNIPATCAPSSGSCFPVGTTTVTCMAVDAAGNKAQCSFHVTVGSGGSICGNVFFDSNCNSLNDNGDTPLAGWKVQLLNGSTVLDTRFTDSSGNYCFAVSTAGTYTVVSIPPNANWHNSTLSSVQVTIGPESCSGTANFGACCTVSIAGGFTPGYWHNRNGQAVLAANDPAWRTLLNNLCLRDAAGNNYDVPSGSFGNAFSSFRNWILSDASDNMAYKLSSHLAAATLNVAYKGLNSNANLMLTPSLAACYGAPTANLGTVMTQANASLCAHGLTPSGDPNRAYQECLKDILDAVNNNQLPSSGSSSSCAFNSPY